MKMFFCCVAIFMFTIISTAQRTEQYYDYQWRPAKPENALFFSIIEGSFSEDGDDFYYRRNYYIREDKLQMEGIYEDEKCTKKFGNFLYYYPNGKLEIDCNYSNNRLQGRYLSFYYNGRMKEFSQYNKGNLIGSSFSLYPNGVMKDSVETYKDGSGSAASWHGNGKPSSAGYFAAGRKKRGTWQFFHYNGKLSALEEYDNGKLLNKKYFDENGIEEKDTINTDRELSFPGGESAWIKYVSQYAHFPIGWDIRKTGAVVLVVSAVIDEEGKVTNAYVSSPFHPAFDAIALKIIQSSPGWIPAISHHRKIKSTVMKPISFTQRFFQLSRY